jgi:hypothetical protein
MTQPETPPDAGLPPRPASPGTPQRPCSWVPGLWCPECGQARLQSCARRHWVVCPACQHDAPMQMYA